MLFGLFVYWEETMKTLLEVAIIILLAAPCFAGEGFKDVPEDHWAKEAVDMVSTDGIMNGYPDNTFKGDRPVTRYELCVALANMVEFIQASRQPVIKDGDKKSESAPSVNWTAPSIDKLKSGGFLPADSPVLTGGDGPVTTKELGDALAQVSAKLIELTVSPAGAPD